MKVEEKAGEAATEFGNFSSRPRVPVKLPWSAFVALSLLLIITCAYAVSDLSRNVVAGAAIFGFLAFSMISFLGLGWARLRRAFASGISTHDEILFNVFRNLIGPIGPAIAWFAFTIAGTVVLMILLVDFSS